ncbi:hypothetical protein VUR80DRAFT_4465 [Thermomyces stellatus]
MPVDGHKTCFVNRVQKALVADCNAVQGVWQGRDGIWKCRVRNQGSRARGEGVDSGAPFGGTMQAAVGLSCTYARQQCTMRSTRSRKKLQAARPQWLSWTVSDRDRDERELSSATAGASVSPGEVCAVVTRLARSRRLNTRGKRPDPRGGGFTKEKRGKKEKQKRRLAKVCINGTNN